MMSRIKKKYLIILLTILGLIIVIFGISILELSPVNSKDNSTIIFEITEGTGKSKIADNLKKAKLRMKL